VSLLLTFQVDETTGCADKERLSRLELENKALREMLEICTTSRDKIVPIEVKKDNKDDKPDDDDNTDTECDSTVLVCSSKKEIEEKETEDKTLKKPAEVVSKDIVSPVNKDSTPVASKESSPVVASAKSAVASKSSNDIRKGKTTLPNKTDNSVTLKKTMSSSSPGARKDFPILKKSPSTEVKKDLKGKVTPKPGVKK
jgi:hypothetical protein